MTSTTGKNQTGFTLLELSVVVAIIFILASSLIVVIPMIELKAANAKAQADVIKLDLALGIYKEAERALPPDRYALLNVRGTVAQFFSPSPPTLAEQTNIYMLHYLTTSRSRTVYLEIEESEVTNTGLTMQYNIGSSLLIPRGTTANFPAFMLLDPWSNPYVYDNNRGDSTTIVTTDLFRGAPNHNPDFDLYSTGANGITALGVDGSIANGNSVDDDDDGTPDDQDEVLYNGREREGNGDLGDDHNNFKTEK